MTGCDGEPFRGEPATLPGYSCEQTDCPPAFPTIVNDLYYSAGLGGWCIDVIVQEDGCYCICIDDILPVELIDFDAVSGDARLTLNWSTASESDNDRFDIIRNETVVGRVNASNSATGDTYTWTETDLTNGREYTYSLVSIDMNGVSAELGTVSATPTFNTATVTEYALHQNYPNPFNPSTIIAFDLVEANDVLLKVYNPLGQVIAKLVEGEMEAGRHTVSFDAADLPSGLYFYRLESGDFNAVKKMILMK